ncbi:MAG: amino acid ABC transporter substrate-binding protein [Candidatus Binatia bacterium]|jgi:ABC-type amino acid transport substrate-binding protein
MKILIAFVVTSVLLVQPVYAAEQMPTLEQIKKTGKIRVGYRASEPPMSFLDNNGVPAGYSIDLCSRIVTGIKTKLDEPKISVEYVPVNSSNRFSALSDNKIDILCASTTKTLSRAEIVDFTQLTFVTGASLLSLVSNPINNIAALQGKKVAVVKNTTTIEALKGALKESLTEAEVIPVDTATDGLRALQEKKVDAYSSDQVVLIGLILTSGDPKSFFLASELFSFEPFALAVRRNDADFRLAADRVLSHLYRSGQIVQIYDKWFGRFSKEVPSAIKAMYAISATPE